MVIDFHKWDKLLDDARNPNDFYRKWKKENKMEELKVEKSKVLEAAASCSTFKGIAEKLWPEVFNKISDNVKSGEIYQVGTHVGMVGGGYQGYQMSYLDGGWDDISILNKNKSKKLADSLEEYFKNKGA